MKAQVFSRIFSSLDSAASLGDLLELASEFVGVVKPPVEFSEEDRKKAYKKILSDILKKAKPLLPP